MAAESDQHQYKFDVAMSCSGCSGAVERALKKQDGVKNIDINLEKQSVLVTAVDPATFEVVKAKIAKTGKEVRSGEALS